MTNLFPKKPNSRAVSKEPVNYMPPNLGSNDGLYEPDQPASASCLAGLIRLTKAGRIPAGSVIAATMTGHGLKDPDCAIKASGFEPRVVAPTMEAVTKAIGL